MGVYLNELCDVIVDVVLYLSLFSVLGVCLEVLWLLVWIVVLSEYVGVLGLMVGVSCCYDGLMGKSDCVFVIGVLGLLLVFEWVGVMMVMGVVVVMVVLCVLMMINWVCCGLWEIVVLLN